MIFLDRLSSRTPVSNFTQILPVGAALIYAGGGARTEMMKAMGAFGDFVNTLNKRK